MPLTKFLGLCWTLMGQGGGSAGKESPCKAGDAGSIPGLERSPGGGHGNPLQYSCLENPMDREAWQATALPGSLAETSLVAKSQT